MEYCIIFVLLLFSPTSILGDLYKSSDHVIILNNKNFYQELLGTSNGWIVEFYNSWCGHCIGFAPTWKKFSSEVQRK